MRRPGDQPIKHLFILHNGLNEAENLRFYYRLADWIFSEYAENDSGGTAACMIMPFGGHLMHAPFQGPFSQTPLSRYLGDSGELFRQFLRYMVHMRWLLSAVAQIDEPSWRVGWNVIDAPRIDQLVDTLHGEWATLAEASYELLRRLEDEETRAELAERRVTTTQVEQRAASTRERLIGTEVKPGDIRAAVQVLRSVLQGRPRAARPRLRTHVVGYSLGGFLAQSVFFAWPQHVSSCTTICSGGAISAISPTAFAHKEEWQAVLHSLDAELEDAMLNGRLSRGPDEQMVAGMRAPQFGYFKRIFDQVFLQVDQGSYRQRLSEYSARMLFMSGGEDPIVKPEEVLDASPSEGINMLSVANLTHFLAVEPRGDRPQEIAQREFWLPEVGRLIARAAMRAEELADDELETAEEARGTPRAKASARAQARDRRRRRRRVPKERPRTADLSSNDFDDALDWVLDAVKERQGWLIVARNTLPAALLASQRFSEWGKALHHHDARVQRYARGLHNRSAALSKRRKRVILLVPDKLEQWFVEDSALFDPQSDTPHGRFIERGDRRRLWTGFEKRWRPNMRELHPDRLDKLLEGSGLDDPELIAALTRWQKVDGEHLWITHLPDVWISFDGSTYPATPSTRRLFEENFVAWVAALVGELRPGRTGLRPEVDEGSSADQLERHLREGRIRIVQVSDAEFNPRYRGRIETSRGGATRLLAQCAAGMLRSRPRVAGETATPSQGSA
jgi:pimeloyl-ACP methyl ester carboxylesterase